MDHIRTGTKTFKPTLGRMWRVLKESQGGGVDEEPDVIYFTRKLASDW